jgi:hypothetical protein
MGGGSTVLSTNWSSRTKRGNSSNSKHLLTIFACIGLGLLVAPLALLRYSLSNPPQPHNNRLQHKSVQQQQQDRVMKNPLDETKYHVVFSTDCSEYHNWQSYVLFFHAERVGQPGTITRIASGCTAKEEKEMEDFHYHRIESMSGRFKIHFTPSYSTVDGSVFLYFNKPFGLRHWMEHVLGFPKRQDDDDAIIILLDPDMILTRPLTRHFNATDKWQDKNIKSFTVDHGKPVAQQYLLGALWLTWDLTKIVGESSPALKVKHDEAVAHYQVGPPYIATAKDMYQIAVKWTEFAPATKAVFPDMLAEMFAYIIAAAHLELPHTHSNSLMLSDVNVAYTEPWDWIETEPLESICRKDYGGMLPNVLHYCQPYTIQGYEFYKIKLKNRIHKCSHPILEEPPLSLLDGFNWSTPHPAMRRKSIVLDSWAMRINQREAFMTCQLILRLNEAMEHQRIHACRHGGNASKTFRLADVH